MRRVGWAIVGVVALFAVVGPWLTPNRPATRFDGAAYAPPMPVRFIDANGGWRAPFVYPVRLVSRLERRFEEDRTRPVPLAWFSGGTFVRLSDEHAGPWLPLGGDSYGRDVFARLAHGSRLSLGVAILATLGALLIGTVIGGLAGISRGTVDALLMRVSDVVLILPSMYVVLALRAALPLVLPGPVVFTLVSGILAVVGWPLVARGVRAIVAGEGERDYAFAARALGVGRWRLLVRHLLPAARGFLVTQATLLVPAFILAEATLSFVGLGFPDPATSWGTMLQEAANVAAIADAPWTLSPALAIFLVVLGVNLSVGRPGIGAAK